jgi:AraC family transcriptional activator of pyochelin receptor
LYGMPVFTFLFHYKMEHAKKLLAINGNNVNEVATQIGYSTSSHFIVAFKKKFGITPKQFTKQEINN